MSIAIEIDLSETQRAAQQVETILKTLSTKYELGRYEYTRKIRIAPNEIPHSHPVLTINTRLRLEAPVLSVYLHEQMHWYVTWYSYANPDGWHAINKSLHGLYPEVPIEFPDGAGTEQSSYLHIIVNWLEIASTSDFLGDDLARQLAQENFVYQAIYQIVLCNWHTLKDLFLANGIYPIRHATTLSENDLRFAANVEEAQ